MIKSILPNAKNRLLLWLIILGVGVGLGAGLGSTLILSAYIKIPE